MPSQREQLHAILDDPAIAAVFQPDPATRSRIMAALAVATADRNLDGLLELLVNLGVPPAASLRVMSLSVSNRGTTPSLQLDDSVVQKFNMLAIPPPPLPTNNQVTPPNPRPPPPPSFLVRAVHPQEQSCLAHDPVQPLPPILCLSLRLHGPRPYIHRRLAQYHSYQSDTIPIMAV
ncbi:hypothetical protein C8R46DRAFT_1356791 [Mycena filopes]|nr:hypothetical protein C8R46DRAFT_1356791 [Mycena filopes]